MDKEKEIGHWTTDVTMEYHKLQFLESKRSTVALEKFLSLHTDLKGNVLGFACGGGTVDAYFAKLYKELTITGVDIVDRAF